MITFENDPLKNKYSELSLLGLVKIYNTNTSEHSSGFIVGTDPISIYVATTSHSSENQMTVFINGKNNLYVDAHKVVEDAGLDLAVLKISRDEVRKIAGNQAFMKLFPMAIERSSSTCLMDEEVVLNGYASGSFQAGSVKSRIEAGSYYDDYSYYRLQSSGVESGHSGSPVFNSLMEIIGMQVELNNVRTAAKVLKLDKILNFLKLRSIPTDLLQYNSWIGSYKVNSLMMSGHKPIDLRSRPVLTLHNDGRVSGLFEGTFCITNAGSSITFHVTNQEVLKIEKPGSDFWTAIQFPGLPEPFTVNVVGTFDFSGNNGAGLATSLNNSSYSLDIIPYKRSTR